MKLDEKAFTAAVQQYGFAGGVWQPGGFKWTRDFLNAYCAALPSDEGLIENMEEVMKERIRQHQSIQTPPVCNDSGKDVNKPPEHQSDEGKDV